VKRVGGAWLEVGHGVGVEVAGFRRFGVHQQTSAADVVREFNQASKNVLEHSGAESGTLVVDVHAEPGE
jgi:hypothetical protein